MVRSGSGDAGGVAWEIRARVRRAGERVAVHSRFSTDAAIAGIGAAACGIWGGRDKDCGNVAEHCGQRTTAASRAKIETGCGGAHGGSGLGCAHSGAEGRQCLGVRSARSNDRAGTDRIARAERTVPGAYVDREIESVWSDWRSHRALVVAIAP